MRIHLAQQVDATIDATIVFTVIAGFFSLTERAL